MRLMLVTALLGLAAACEPTIERTSHGPHFPGGYHASEARGN